MPIGVSAAAVEDVVPSERSWRQVGHFGRVAIVADFSGGDSRTGPARAWDLMESLPLASGMVRRR
jgi:hypothetical protein